MQNTWLFLLFYCFDLQLLDIYYIHVTIDADSTYKQAIMLYGDYMNRIGKSLKKQNVSNEAT